MVGNCNSNSSLKWVQGNDVLLLARVYEKVMESNTVTDAPFDLTACDDIAVKCAHGYITEVLEAAIAQNEDNCLVLRIPASLTAGGYDIEVTCRRGGFQVRSFEFAFEVVEKNCESNTTFSIVDGCQSANLRVSLQIVPQSAERGKSAYELWKELPGNADKTLQDYIDEVLDFHTRADQINAAEAQRVLKENERQAMEQNRQEAEVQRQADTQAAVNAANAAATGAERVNATLSGTTLTVTNRNGVSTSVDTKGEPGDDGVGVPSGGSAGQVLSKASGTDYDTQWVNPPADGVNSVNGKSGDVTLDASDVGALPDDTVIPSEVTEQTVSDWGFTKNTGTYSKPSGGIPKTDLSSDVQTSLGKADTALQSFTESDPTVPSWAKQQSKPSYSYSEISNTPDLSGFITNAVDDLVNYYLKSETYTKGEVATLIGAIQQFHYEIYASTSAVTTPAHNVLYLIGPTGSGSDKYEEYVYDSTKESPWIKIGDTSIDLSGYYTSAQTDTAISTALADYTTTANLTTLLAAKANSADLATVATSGDYDDLTNKPTIPTVPTNVSAFTNDAGYLTSHQDISDKADKVSSATSGNFAALDANGNLTDSGHKHSDYLTRHQDLSNYVQKSQTAGLLKNDGAVDTNTYLTQHQDISGKQDVIDAQHKLSADLVDDSTATNKFVTASDKQAWNGKQDALTFETTPSSSNKVATMADMPTTMGASGSTHKGGLVPDTPSTAGTTKFLREDGTWAEIKPTYINPTTAASYTINPNVEYFLNTISQATTLTLSNPDGTAVNEYKFQFDMGSTVYTISGLSASILWQGGVPSFEANKHYEISIKYDPVGQRYFGLCSSFDLT